MRKKRVHIYEVIAALSVSFFIFTPQGFLKGHIGYIQFFPQKTFDFSH